MVAIGERIGDNLSHALSLILVRFWESNGKTREASSVMLRRERHDETTSLAKTSTIDRFDWQYATFAD
jgi:hypothetical protein